MRLIAILSGGDWTFADVDVEHVKVPDDLDLQKARRLYDKWQKTKPVDEDWDYCLFVPWLVKTYGAIEATDEDIEYFEMEGLSD